MHVLVLLLRCARQNKVMCELYTVQLRCVKCRELRSIVRKLCKGGGLICVCCKRIEECESIMTK